MKQHGGLLAKGRLLGIQFQTLFENDLYYTISKHAVEMATRLKNAFALAGIKMAVDSSTNQLFPILKQTQMDALSKKYSYTFWGKLDDEHSIVRFCTSWATSEEQIAALEKDIQIICK